jgi:hypothetical protein
MNGIRTTFASGGDQPLDREVALGGLGRSNPDGEVGGTHVGAAAICRGVHGHCLDSFFVTGSNDSQGDLTAVGNENPLYRSKRTLRLTWLGFERGGVALESDCPVVCIIPVYGRHAGGGASPKTRRKLLQSSTL